MNFMRLTGSSADASDACSELPSARPCGVTVQMIERDGAPWIIGVLPRCDRYRLVQLQRALAHQDAGERRDHRFGGGESEQRRIDADAVGMTLGYDVGVFENHDRLGSARRDCQIERHDRAQQPAGRWRRDDGGAGDVRQ